MNLNQLLYFSVTARHLHFTRAAEELFISQPSLSYAISSLEDELGIPLFEKKGRNVILTQQGALFLNHVERALSEIQHGREALERMNSEIDNHIEIAAFSTALHNHNLPEILRKFTALPENHDVHFNFTQCSDAEMLDGLRSMKFDVAFPTQITDATGIEYTPLITCNMNAYVPNDHPLAKKSSLTLTDLADCPLVVGENTPCTHILQRLLPDATITCRVHEHSAMFSFAAENFGAAITLPNLNARFYPLKPIPITSPECRCTIYLAHKKDRYLPAPLERFIHQLHSLSE